MASHLVVSGMLNRSPAVIVAVVALSIAGRTFANTGPGGDEEGGAPAPVVKGAKAALKDAGPARAAVTAPVSGPSTATTQLPAAGDAGPTTVAAPAVPPPTVQVNRQVPPAGERKAAEPKFTLFNCATGGVPAVWGVIMLVPFLRRFRK